MSIFNYFYNFFAAVLNFLLMEIFASSNYIIYFLFFIAYLYFFNKKIKLYKVVLYVVLIYMSIILFNENIFEFFLYLEIYKYYIYIDANTGYILSFIHMVLLGYVSYYFDLKKMGYNLIKK